MCAAPETPSGPAGCQPVAAPERQKRAETPGLEQPGQVAEVARPRAAGRGLDAASSKAARGRIGQHAH